MDFWIGETFSYLGEALLFVERATLTGLPVMVTMSFDAMPAASYAVTPPSPGTWLRDVADHQVVRLASGMRVSRHVDTVELQPERGPLTYRWRQDTWVEGDDADPAAITAATGLQREGWAVAAFAEVTLVVDGSNLHLALALRVTRDEREVWAERIDATTRRVWTWRPVHAILDHVPSGARIDPRKGGCGDRSDRRRRRHGAPAGAAAHGARRDHGQRETVPRLAGGCAAGAR